MLVNLSDEALFAEVVGQLIAGGMKFPRFLMPDMA